MQKSTGSCRWTFVILRTGMTRALSTAAKDGEPVGFCAPRLDFWGKSEYNNPDRAATLAVSAECRTASGKRRRWERVRLLPGCREEPVGARLPGAGGRWFRSPAAQRTEDCPGKLRRVSALGTKRVRMPRHPNSGGTAERSALKSKRLQGVFRIWSRKAVESTWPDLRSG